MKKPARNKKTLWGLVGPRNEIYPSYIRESKKRVLQDILEFWSQDWKTEQNSGYQICRLKIEVIK
jgi:hypothetical protein